MGRSSHAVRVTVCILLLACSPLLAQRNAAPQSVIWADNVSEMSTIIAGTLRIGQGTQWSNAALQTASSGATIATPALVPHFAQFSKGTEVEVHGGLPSQNLSVRNTPEDVTAEITRLENELADAVVRRDFDTLRRIEAEQYVYTDSDAKVSTRDDFIRDYVMERSRIHSLRFHDMVVTSVGDTAVVRGILSVERTDNGRVTSRSTRYTRVYVRLPTGWQAIVGHSSELKQQQAEQESARRRANLQEIPESARAIEELRIADEVRRVAMLHADVAVLDNLLADDATIVWGDGTTDDKQSMLALFRSGRLQYSQFEYGNTRARLYGNTGVVTGEARVRLQSNGQSMAHHVHVTLVYVRDHEHWQLVASQTTRMPSE